MGVDTAGADDADGVASVDDADVRGREVMAGAAGGTGRAGIAVGTGDVADNACTGLAAGWGTVGVLATERFAGAVTRLDLLVARVTGLTDFFAASFALVDFPALLLTGLGVLAVALDALTVLVAFVVLVALSALATLADEPFFVTAFLPVFEFIFFAFVDFLASFLAWAASVVGDTRSGTVITTMPRIAARRSEFFIRP